jgi:hypothetical protein
MHIHLELNGVFLYFLTRQLNLDEMENWEGYPVVYLTPDSDQWDPNVTHFLEQEAAMLDSDGYIIDRTPYPRTIFGEADLSALYVDPPTWDQFDAVVDNVMDGDDNGHEGHTTGEFARAYVGDVQQNPALFADTIREKAHVSNA